MKQMDKKQSKGLTGGLISFFPGQLYFLSKVGRRRDFFLQKTLNQKSQRNFSNLNLKPWASAWTDDKTLDKHFPSLPQTLCLNNLSNISYPITGLSDSEDKWSHPEAKCFQFVSATQNLKAILSSPSSSLHCHDYNIWILINLRSMMRSNGHLPSLQ